MGKAIWFRTVKGLKIMLLAAVGCFLLGVLLCFLVVRVFPDEGDVTSALVASFLALVATETAIIVAGGIGMQREFHMAVSMSHTRRRFLIEEGAVSMLLTCIGQVFCYVLYRLDMLVIHFCYSDVPIDKELDTRLIFGFILENPVNLLCALMAIISLRLLMGALFLRFGQWAFWVIWIAIMTLAKAEHLQQESEAVTQMMRTISNLASRINGLFFQICGIVLSLVAIVITTWLLRKQQVKGC